MGSCISTINAVLCRAVTLQNNLFIPVSFLGGETRIKYCGNKSTQIHRAKIWLPEPGCEENPSFDISSAEVHQFHGAVPFKAIWSLSFLFPDQTHAECGLEEELGWNQKIGGVRPFWMTWFGILSSEKG